MTPDYDRFDTLLHRRRRAMAGDYRPPDQPATPALPERPGMASLLLLQRLLSGDGRGFGQLLGQLSQPRT